MQPSSHGAPTIDPRSAILKFYYNLAPNPTKVALFLEESGHPYELIPVDTRKGEQHAPASLAINPNAKVPAIVDGDVTMFDSNAILLYLAEKTGQFLPPSTPASHGELLSWHHAVTRKVGTARIGCPRSKVPTMIIAAPQCGKTKVG